MKLRALLDNMIVEILPPEKDDMLVGDTTYGVRKFHVLEVGPGDTNYEGRLESTGIKQGDTVLIQSNGEAEFTYQGKRCKYFGASSVIAVVENE